MGDVNEIRQLIRRESESFLQHALHETKELGAAYDFEAEFAKTRQNRSFLVWGATAATILALGLAAFGVTLAIRRGAANAPVDVQAFADLNLRDLLDTAKRNESDMNRAKQELSRLDYDYRSSVDSADRAYAAAVQSIRARNLPANQEDRELRAAASTNELAKRRLQADYLPAAAAQRTQIGAIQAKIDKYDRRLMDQAKQQQAVLDNERRLFDLQMKRQSDAYEGQLADLKAARGRDITALTRQRDELAAALTARYNPLFADDRSASLLGSWKPPANPGPSVELPPYLAEHGFLDAGSSTRLDQSLSDFRYLAAKLLAVPYLNSVPPALSRMQDEALSAIAVYRATLVKAAAALERQDARILELTAAAAAAQSALDEYRWAVTALLRSNGEGGYILDPRDVSSVIVALNPALPAVAGSSGYVVRNDRVIAHVSFYLKDGALRARVTDTPPPQLVPFDTILVDAATAPAAPNDAAPPAPSSTAPAAPSDATPSATAPAASSDATPSSGQPSAAQ